LFFDSRIDESMLATEESILAKVHRRVPGGKIRLVFSGRINRIKGADDLRIPFQMTICGDGESLSAIRSDISARGLVDCVELTGTLEFKAKLVPFVTEFADLFVCCHRQGDPSCTYLETMACGVPIVGYANDAFSALADYSKVGWVTPMSDPLALAKNIAKLYESPQGVDHASRQSRLFAGEHTFRGGFKRRIDHLKDVARHYGGCA
jgi:glycosyltransferase involved in cell wall biosynthesis